MHLVTSSLFLPAILPCLDQPLRPVLLKAFFRVGISRSPKGEIQAVRSLRMQSSFFVRRLLFAFGWVKEDLSCGSRNAWKSQASCRCLRLKILKKKKIFGTKCWRARQSITMNIPPRFAFLFQRIVGRIASSWTGANTSMNRCFSSSELYLLMPIRMETANLDTIPATWKALSY